MIDKLHQYRVEKFLNATGEGFCLEKWHSTTLHLETGTEHGCHHPGPVKIDPTELDKPENLFNHQHKIQVRQQMLDGDKPLECSYCWKSTGTQDRILQSGKSYNWQNRHIKSTKSIPKYLEVSFSNVCNLGCAYCGPSFSSIWQQEIERQGAYPNEHHRHFVVPIPQNKPNPYVQAFWQWWPELKEHLHELRITGGEPLLSKHTFYMLQDVNNINTTVNTNLAVSESILEKFADSAKNIKNLTIAISGESSGTKAEYARHGLNYEKFLYNLAAVQNLLPMAKIHIMSTYNCLCVTSFKNFLIDVKNIAPTASLSITRLQNPTFFDHRILPYELKIDALQYVKQNFNNEAYLRLKNIVNDLESIDLTQQKTKLKMFAQEFDRRRKTNFAQTFPELQ